MGNNKLLNAALGYAARGLAVLPLEYKGKKPITEHGVMDATTDAEQINSWWEESPFANIGIAMGSKSHGVFAIDIDVDEDKGIDGMASWKEFEKEFGELPETAMTVTGRGGNHLLYHSASEISNRVGAKEGIDVRGEGGFIVAPPSVHQNGRTYEWENDLDDFGIQEASENVLKLVSLGAVKPIGEKKDKFILPDVISGGKRNDTLFKYACSLQSQGKSDNDIMMYVMGAAVTKCDPPLTSEEQKELRKTIESALKYEKGPIQLKRNEKGKVIQSIENARIILDEDDNLSGKMRFNELSYNIYVYGKLPWMSEAAVREWNNHDKSALLAYMENTHHYYSEKNTFIAFDNVTQKYKFNPLQDMLNNIPKWDGKPYIEKLLPKYLGADFCELNTAIMKTFMTGAVARAFNPGCKFDYMLVLVGPQGIGKSYFLSKLSLSSEWFDDNFNTIDGKEASERLRGKWIVEMAELLASKKSRDVEAMKAFITSRIDSYRPPYKEITESRPRSCVFTGTTNDEWFLTDPTGNRRFLPVQLALNDESKKALFNNIKELEQDIQGAWAEAIHIFKTNKPGLIFPHKYEQMLSEKRSNFVQEDPKVGVIRRFLDETTHEKICSLDVWHDALYETKNPTNYDCKQIVQILDLIAKEHGWVKIGKSNTNRAKNVVCFIREASHGSPGGRFDS